MLRRGERWKRVKEVGGQPQADSAGGQDVVWDHAAFHQAKAVGEGGCPNLLNPAKRVFAEVRRWVEGRRYESMEAKQATVEGLRRLKAEKRGSYRWWVGAIFVRLSVP